MNQSQYSIFSFILRRQFMPYDFRYQISNPTFSAKYPPLLLSSYGFNIDWFAEDVLSFYLIDSADPVDLLSFCYNFYISPFKSPFFLSQQQ